MSVKFITGLMGSGKTAKLISDYESAGPNTKVVRVIAENNGITRVISRNGKSIDNVTPIFLEDDLSVQLRSLEKVFDEMNGSLLILIDEVQFLDISLILEIFHLEQITKNKVILYGLHSDFRGDLFPASCIALDLSDKVVNISMECEDPRCTNEAEINARFKEDGSIDVDGPVIVQEKSSYRSICKDCKETYVYFKK